MEIDFSNTKKKIKMENLNAEINETVNVIINKYDGVEKCSYYTDNDGKNVMTIYFSNLLTLKVIVYYFFVVNMECNIVCHENPRHSKMLKKQQNLFEGSGLAIIFKYDVSRGDDFLPIKIYCNRLLRDLKSENKINDYEFGILLNKSLNW